MSHTPESVTETVREIIAKHLDIPLGGIVRDAQLMATLDGDSLDAVEIGMLVEEAFEVEIPDDKLWSRELTVGDLVDAALEALNIPQPEPVP